MKVLIVDDDAFALALLSRQFKSLGFPDVTTCVNSQEAHALLVRNPNRFGLIACDLQMPGGDGVECIRQLAQMGFTGAILLVSGEDSRIRQTAERLARAHGLHVVGALAKPVPLGALQRAIEARDAPRPPPPPAALPVYDSDEVQRGMAAGEFTYYYQPKIEVRSGAVVGVECLMRWRHPTDSLVLPEQFIRTAEDHGLIDSLTRTGLVCALRQARQWADAGHTLDVAVNLSMDSLIDRTFPDFVSTSLAEAGVQPRHLVLELTETQLLRDPCAALEVFARLALKRVRLSIDDFGTGQSTLVQLRDFPFDELKIDRGFVHNAHSDGSLRAIFTASRQMARDLGMRIVAEGVEDRADWDFLQETDCDLAQGYFMAQPMPGADVSPWITGWRERRRALYGLGA